MPHFIKTGYWEKLSKAPKGYLNLDQFTDKREAIDISHMPFKPGSVGPKVSFKKENYSKDVDMIIPGVLELTRGNNQGLYNAALQPGWASPGPTNTLWSSQNIDPDYVNWGPLENVEGRTFGTWNQSNNTPEYTAPYTQVGQYRALKETTTGRIWLIKFTEWTPGAGGGGFAYDRWEILQSVTFQRPTGDENVIDKVSDSVHIARQNITGYSGEQILYNTIGETEPRPAVSPVNVRWNTDHTDSRTGYSGFGDLSNLERRVYQDFYDSFNNIDTDIVGKEIIMHDLSTDLYYKVVFSVWEPTGGGGAFEYTRTVIPQSLPVRFGDGSVQTTAAFGSGGGGASIFIPGSGTCSSVRCNVGNTASGCYSASLGGYNNTASGCYATILNGWDHTASGHYSFIGNGAIHTAGSWASTVLNGFENTASSDYSTILGGRDSDALQNYSTIVNGCCNIVDSHHSIVGNGYCNTITGSSAYATIVNGHCNTISGWYSFIGNGLSHTASSYYSTVVNGTSNIASGSGSLIVNGGTNTSSGTYSAILNGFNNNASNQYATILNGTTNISSGYSSLANGRENTASGKYSTILNGSCIVVSGCYGAAVSGNTNSIAGCFSTILNGDVNNICAAGCYGAILNGQFNTVQHAFSAASGVNITTSLACAFHANRLVLTTLPTSSAGLPAGAVWVDVGAGNVLKIV